MPAPQRGAGSPSGLLLAGLLLAGHGLLLALAGACVGLRALAVHRQPAAMPQALVAPDLDLAPDIGLDLAAQVTLDLVVRLDPVPELYELRVAHLMNAGVTADAGTAQRLQCAGPADAVDIGKGNLKPLLSREVNANQACHRGQLSFCCGGRAHRARARAYHTVPMTRPRPPPGVLRPPCRRAECDAYGVVRAWPGAVSALTLLVPRVRADDHHPAMPSDDPAFAADLLHARLDFHGQSLPGAVRPSLVTCTGRRSGRGSGRTGSAQRPPGRRAGSEYSASASCR